MLADPVMLAHREQIQVEHHQLGIRIVCVLKTSVCGVVKEYHLKSFGLDSWPSELNNFDFWQAK